MVRSTSHSSDRKLNIICNICLNENSQHLAQVSIFFSFAYPAYVEAPSDRNQPANNAFHENKSCHQGYEVSVSWFSLPKQQYHCYYVHIQKLRKVLAYKLRMICFIMVYHLYYPTLWPSLLPMTTIRHQIYNMIIYNIQAVRKMRATYFGLNHNDYIITMCSYRKYIFLMSLSISLTCF